MTVRVIVATSNRYAFLMRGFAHQWLARGGATLPVTVLYYDVAPPPLPEPFSILSLGSQDAYSWSGGLRAYLRMIGDEHVIFMLEDYWLIEDLRLEHIAFAERYMQEHPEVHKVDLASDRQGHRHTDYDEHFIRSANDENCLTSVMAAIWRRDFFLECLGNYDETPWAFETTGTHRLWGKPDLLILGAKVPSIIYKLVVRGGRPEQLLTAELPERDRDGLVKAGII